MELEEKIETLDLELCKEEVYSNPSEAMRVQKEKEDTSSSLEQTILEWEERHETLEEMDE